MDVKTDFYKRYGHEGGTAAVEFSPAAVCIFKSKTTEVGLKLSFGASTAYRGRSDGRLVISRTSSNLKESINLSELDKFRGEVWARELINLIKKISAGNIGGEFLIHRDVEDNAFASENISFLKAFLRLNTIEATPQAIITLTEMPAYMTAALTDSKIAVTDITDKGFLTYNPDFCNKKIIVVKAGGKNKLIKLPKQYYDREQLRIKALTGNIMSIGTYMKEASTDMLSYLSNDNIKCLFEEIINLSDYVRILPDLSGAVVIVSDETVDEFISLVASRYEKKTGIIPAFYISD